MDKNIYAFYKVKNIPFEIKSTKGYNLKVLSSNYK